MGQDDRHQWDDPARGGWWLPLAIGWAVVVGLALTAAIFLGQPESGPRPETAAPLSSRISLAARAALVALGSNEEEFETARAELLEVLDARGEELPDETRTTVSENLEIIESQIAAISEELSRDPDNRRLARLLAAAYQRELELLQRAAALPAMTRDEDES
jgi:hypothetical protein